MKSRLRNISEFTKSSTKILRSAFINSGHLSIKKKFVDAQKKNQSSSRSTQHIRGSGKDFRKIKNNQSLKMVGIIS